MNSAPGPAVPKTATAFRGLNVHLKLRSYQGTFKELSRNLHGGQKRSENKELLELQSFTKYIETYG